MDANVPPGTVIGLFEEPDDEGCIVDYGIDDANLQACPTPPPSDLYPFVARTRCQRCRIHLGRRRRRRRDLTSIMVLFVCLLVGILRGGGHVSRVPQQQWFQSPTRSKANQDAPITPASRKGCAAGPDTCFLAGALFDPLAFCDCMHARLFIGDAARRVSCRTCF